MRGAQVVEIRREEYERTKRSILSKIRRRLVILGVVIGLLAIVAFILGGVSCHMSSTCRGCRSLTSSLRLLCPGGSRLLLAHPQVPQSQRPGEPGQPVLHLRGRFGAFQPPRLLHRRQMAQSAARRQPLDHARALLLHPRRWLVGNRLASSSGPVLSSVLMVLCFVVYAALWLGIATISAFGLVEVQYISSSNANLIYLTTLVMVTVSLLHKAVDQLRVCLAYGFASSPRKVHLVVSPWLLRTIHRKGSQADEFFGYDSHSASPPLFAHHVVPAERSSSPIFDVRESAILRTIAPTEATRTRTRWMRVLLLFSPSMPLRVVQAGLHPSESPGDRGVLQRGTRTTSAFSTQRGTPPCHSYSSLWKASAKEFQLHAQPVASLELDLLRLESQLLPHMLSWRCPRQWSRNTCIKFRLLPPFS
jgi:hypothetical protein